MALVPVLLGVGMAYFLRQVYMLAMAVFSPVMLLGSYVSDRRHGRKSYARQQAEYEERKARIERDAREALQTERVRRRHDCPTRPRCCPSRRAPGGGCGNGAAPTRTTCCSGSAPPTCRPPWS